MQKKENKLCKKSLTQPTAHEYNGVSRRDTPSPPSPPKGGKGLSFIIARLRSRRQAFSQKKITFFCTIFLDSGQDFKRKRQVDAPKKSEKKCTKDVDGCRSGLYAIRMKIENEIKWSDLADIEVCGGCSTVAYVTSAFSKVLNRELTEDECEFVTNEFNVELYNLEFERKY